MGSCWNTPLPTDSGHSKEQLGHYGGVHLLPPSILKNSTNNPGVEFGREERKLKELFKALRTGLVFSPTNFSVLPGVCTTAKVKFTLGNTELQRIHDENDQDEEEFPEAVVLIEDGDSENSEESNNKVDPFPFRVTLSSNSWANELTMKLIVWPIVGPFANRKLVFLWSGNILKIQGCDADELNARLLPLSFESETEFCKCCLSLVYQSRNETAMQMEERVYPNGKHRDEEEALVVSLKILAYKAAVSNLDTVKDMHIIPSKMYHQFFGSESPVSLSVKLWPKALENQFIATSVMKVKSHILFSEYVYLLREHFNIPYNYTLKLYHNFKTVQMTSPVTQEYKQLDCFIIDHGGPSVMFGSYMEPEEEMDVNVTLVASLVGKQIQNIKADLEMSMRDIDTMLRGKFELKDDSFLFIISEDDFSPQYTADDNWKCTYPFNVPNNSISAGIRRSFRKLTTRQVGANSPIQSQRFQRSPNFDPSSIFAPHMAEVVLLLSSDNRHFPSNAGKYYPSVKELHASMPMYNMSIEQCGIHPFSIVQVFEVTGPSIPITVRLLSDYNLGPVGILYQQAVPPRTSLANIMDINPDWSVQTFLQYVDAIISPGTGSRRKRVILGDNYFEDSSREVAKISIGELLNCWKPAWWPLEGTRQTQLTAKDIDPSEFLLIEKY